MSKNNKPKSRDNKPKSPTKVGGLPPRNRIRPTAISRNPRKPKK